MASVHATRDAEGVELDELGLPVGTLEEQEFEDAASVVRGEIARGRTVPKETLLELYGLYKQSTVGNCFEEAPTIVNWAARQKWKAWKGRHGMTEEDAMGKYVEIVTRILPEWKNDGGNSIALGNVQARIQANTDEVTEEEKQTVHGCSRVGNLEQLEALVSAGKDVNETDGEGRSPLHWAADKGHLAVVEFLLRHGADPNRQDEDGCTPLHNAVICKHRAVCDCLCSAGADPARVDREGDSALEFWPPEWPAYQPIH